MNRKIRDLKAILDEEEKKGKRFRYKIKSENLSKNTQLMLGFINFFVFLWVLLQISGADQSQQELLACLKMEVLQK